MTFREKHGLGKTAWHKKLACPTECVYDSGHGSSQHNLSARSTRLVGRLDCSGFSSRMHGQHGYGSLGERLVCPARLPFARGWLVGDSAGVLPLPLARQLSQWMARSSRVLPYRLRTGRTPRVLHVSHARMVHRRSRTNLQATGLVQGQTVAPRRRRRRQLGRLSKWRMCPKNPRRMARTSHFV